MKEETSFDVLIEIRELVRNQKEILNLNEFCSYIGFEKFYIYKLTSKRKIPHYKTPGGKSIFFRNQRLTNG